MTPTAVMALRKRPAITFLCRCLALNVPWVEYEHRRAHIYQDRFENRMSSLSAVPKIIALLMLWAIIPASAALGQETRKLSNSAVIVRLCPSTCVAVNGHGLSPGGQVTVYEQKSGWLRVSNYLNRSRLVATFGESITQNPALWIAASQLEGAAAAQSQQQTRTAAARQKKRVTLPKFRPGTSFASTAAGQTTQAASETASSTPSSSDQVTSPAAATVATAGVAAAGAAASSNVQFESPAGGTERVLSWEELQKKLAEQAEQQKGQTGQSDTTAVAPAAVGTETSAAPATGAKVSEAAATEAERRAAEEARKAAIAEQAKAIEAAEIKRLAEEKKAADAEVAAQAEKARQAEAEAQADAARELAEKQAAEAERIAEAEKAAQAQAAVEALKASEASKIAEAENISEAQQAAVSLQPNQGQPKADVPAGSGDQVALSAPDTSGDVNVSDPIEFGDRPKKMTKVLLDKRLDKLPGPKSRVREDVVIALRHYALGLLNSGECEGIAGGGSSAVPGMLYVSCTDDPNYLRQFPLKEATW